MHDESQKKWSQIYFSSRSFPIPCPSSIPWISHKPSHLPNLCLSCLLFCRFPFFSQLICSCQILTLSSRWISASTFSKEPPNVYSEMNPLLYHLLEQDQLLIPSFMMGQASPCTLYALSYWLPVILLGSLWYYIYFEGKETKAQNGEVTRPRTHSQ